MSLNENAISSRSMHVLLVFGKLKGRLISSNKQIKRFSHHKLQNVYNREIKIIEIKEIRSKVNMGIFFVVGSKKLQFDCLESKWLPANSSPKEK